MLHVDEEGILKEDVPKWGGMYYLKVNKLVNEDLEKSVLEYAKRREGQLDITQCATELKVACAIPFMG